MDDLALPTVYSPQVAFEEPRAIVDRLSWPFRTITPTAKRLVAELQVGRTLDQLQALMALSDAKVIERATTPGPDGTLRAPWFAVLPSEAQVRAVRTARRAVMRGVQP